jgi:hypothetical protein
MTGKRTRARAVRKRGEYAKVDGIPLGNQQTETIQPRSSGIFPHWMPVSSS